MSRQNLSECAADDPFVRYGMGEAGMQRFRSAKASFRFFLGFIFSRAFCLCKKRTVQEHWASHTRQCSRSLPSSMQHVCTVPHASPSFSAVVKGHGGLMPDASAPPWAQSEKDREQRRLKVNPHYSPAKTLMLLPLPSLAQTTAASTSASSHTCACA